VICNGQDHEVLIQKNSWTVYKCIHCGLGFLDPRPSREEMGALYLKEYFSEQYDEGLDPDSQEFKKRLRNEDHRIRFFKWKKRRGKVLDVGCGMGYFLAASKERGFEVQGIDVSPWASEYVTKRLRIPVKTAEMQEFLFESNSVDVITMWHTLEHIRDLHACIRTAKSWLKDDGVLVVDVPNYEGTDARSKWLEWVGWQLPYHLWHFTPKSLEKLLSNHGFKIVKCKDYHSEVVKDRLRKMGLFHPFPRLFARLFSGTSYAVVAIKCDK
jgi:ubiquinone/menaquinone biosynthesis C-methylase UbiE